MDRLQKMIESLQEENAELKANVQGEQNKLESLEKEKECTFKNLFDEISQLKRQNELLKKTDTDNKRSLETKDREYLDDIENLKRRLKQSEDLRGQIMNEKDRILHEMKEMQERYHNEVQALERENENLHRKLNSTFNSAMLQSQNIIQ
jgi:chromosome segregation ATPase